MSLCEPVQALIFIRPCINLCIHASASASHTKASGQICTPHPDVWVSTIPRLKVGSVSTLPEITLLISPQTHISLPVRNIGHIPVSEL